MTERAGPSKRVYWVTLTLGALALAWAATAVCGYRFGAADQVQYLVRAVEVADPGALAGDPYLEAFDAIRSRAWDPIGALVPEGAMPIAALALTLACAWASAMGLAAVARALLPGVITRGWAGALGCLAPAAMLVVPKEQNWFGLVSLSDVEFTATVAAVPMVAWAIALFVRGRAWWALALAAATLPVHAQTAAYLLTALTLAGAWDRRGSRAQTIAFGVVALVGAVGFVVEHVRRSVDGAVLDAYERIGVSLYAPLIDPTRAPAGAWGGVLAVLLLGACAWVALRRADGAHRGLDRVGVFALASLALPIAGTMALAVGVRSPVVWMLMVGRGLMLAQITALALVGVWGARRVHAGGARGFAALGVLMAVGAWVFPVIGGARGAVALILIAGVMALDAVRPSAARGSGHRLPWAIAGVVGALPLALGAWAFSTREHAWTRPAQTDAWASAWAETQRWARDNTDRGTVFVTPPYRAGWRVGARRPTYGELRDGGLLFFAGEPVLGWAERMRSLGMETAGAAWMDAAWMDGAAPGALREAYARGVRDHAEALAGAGVTHIVAELDHAPGVGARVWSNDAFEIRELGGRFTLGSDDAGP